MSGWTTIGVLILAVLVGTAIWMTTPKGPNQVCVGGENKET